MNCLICDNKLITCANKPTKMKIKVDTSWIDLGDKICIGCGFLKSGKSYWIWNQEEKWYQEYDSNYRNDTPPDDELPDWGEPDEFGNEPGPTFNKY